VLDAADKPKEATDQVAALGDEGGPLRCAACGAVLSEHAKILPVGGTSTPVFVNPAGIFFDLVLVEGPVAVRLVGDATTEATWFAGYAWRCALCRACGSHVGWRWEASAAGRLPGAFVGLIRDAIVEGPA
jgi:hypothetical protein